MLFGMYSAFCHWRGRFLRPSKNKCINCANTPVFYVKNATWQHRHTSRSEKSAASIQCISRVDALMRKYQIFATNSPGLWPMACWSSRAILFPSFLDDLWYGSFPFEGGHAKKCEKMTQTIIRKTFKIMQKSFLN